MFILFKEKKKKAQTPSLSKIVLVENSLWEINACKCGREGWERKGLQLKQ